MNKAPGKIKNVTLKAALLSRTLGVVLCFIVLMALWSGISTWLSVQTTAEQWNLSVSRGIGAELEALRNGYKTRALRLSLGFAQVLDAGETTVDVQPNGTVSVSQGKAEDAAEIIQALRARRDSFPVQDFYVEGKHLFHIVPLSFPEATGKRRSLYIKVLGADFAAQVAKRSGMEILLVSDDAVISSSLLDEEENAFLPKLPPALLDRIKTAEEGYVGKASIALPVSISPTGTSQMAAFYGIVPIRNTSQTTVASLVVLLPEELVIRGPRRVIAGSIAIGLLFTVCMIFLVLRTVTQITEPLRTTSERLRILGSNIVESLGGEETGLKSDPTPSMGKGDAAPERIEELVVLRDAYENLSREVKRSTHYQKVIRETQAALQQSNEELEKFAYTVSHDLRAPLRAIDGFSQLILKKYAPSEVGDEHRRYLERICAATNRMSLLIDEILNLSRLNRAVIKREKLDLTIMVRTIVSELKQSEPDRLVEFVIEDGVAGDGTPGLLRSVLENLLSNAFKFTSKSKAARIEFGITESRGQKAYFVRDNGAGFNMAHADKLFGVFQRLHTIKEFPGTGVGLASVHRIIRRHGGEIWAEGTVNQGATFYFTL